MERTIKASLHSATEKVRSATKAKYQTITDILEHNKILRKAIDDGKVIGISDGLLAISR